MTPNSVVLSILSIPSIIAMLYLFLACLFFLNIISFDFFTLIELSQKAKQSYRIDHAYWESYSIAQHISHNSHWSDLRSSPWCDFSDPMISRLHCISPIPYSPIPYLLILYSPILCLPIPMFAYSLFAYSVFAYSVFAHSMFTYSMFTYSFVHHVSDANVWRIASFFIYNLFSSQLLSKDTEYLHDLTRLTSPLTQRLDNTSHDKQLCYYTMLKCVATSTTGNSCHEIF